MLWTMRILAGTLLLVGLAWWGGRLLFPMPVAAADRAQSAAIPPDPATALGPQAAEAVAAHPGLTGVVPLASGPEALEARIRLAMRAERSIDAQYYIWHADTSGLMLLDALRRAAMRGVRVRLLLDDNGIDAAMDPWLASLDALDGFEVRLFNASPIRRPKWGGFVLHPLRMNRRMHNKSFIVDGAAAIVGGRNVGDEYFHVGDGNHYFDLDVLGVGQVVADTAAVFDAYWNAAAVVGLGRAISAAPDATGLEAATDAARASPAAEAFRSRGPNPADRLRGGLPGMEWTTVAVLADDPAKGLGQQARDTLMISRLSAILGAVDRSLDAVSAYFVPGPRGNALLTGLARDGRRVRVLTNSLAATDVPLVHAGYAKYRKDLLEAGVELWELRPLAGMAQGRSELGPLGISGSSLHAKTFVIDDARVFIGSFNFDPRSAMLNCEMGFLIDSPRLATGTADAFTARLVAVSLRPALTEDGLVWYETLPNGSTITHTEEPGAGLASRALIWLLALFPIEWLL